MCVEAVFFADYLDKDLYIPLTNPADGGLGTMFAVCAGGGAGADEQVQFFFFILVLYFIISSLF